MQTHIVRGVAIGGGVGGVTPPPPLFLYPSVNSVMLVGRCCVVGKYQISERP